MTLKGTTEYEYNSRELLSWMSLGDGSALPWDMEWNASENRVRLSGFGVVNYEYVYDPTASIPAVVVEYQPGGLTFVNIREPDGSLVARVNVTPGWMGSEVQNYHFDALGSTVLLSDETGYDY